MSSVVPKIPRLEQGDQLTRDEFERRYDAMTNLKKAELLEGVVYMPSPVGVRGHSSPHLDLVSWLAIYKASTPGVEAGDNGTIRLDPENEPQPDAFMMIHPHLGGQAAIDQDDYVVGGPELAAEVASSTASYDLHVKSEVYRRNFVREYIVWRVRDKAVDWFILRRKRYERLALTSAGIYESKVFPGLWLDWKALVRRDLARVHQVVQQGLASREHAAFVARLKKK